MTIKDEDDSAVAIFGPPPAPVTEPDHASESVLSTRVPESSDPADAVSAGPRDRISSGAFELPRESFHPPSLSEGVVPPSTIVGNALGRGKEQTPLSTIVGIAGGIVFVLILLSLLLFR